MINLTKPVRRISSGAVREAGKIREVVIILRPPNVIGFRAKGCRKEYQLTAEVCYLMAVKADIAAQKREKQAKKKRANTHTNVLGVYRPTLKRGTNCTTPGRQNDT